MRKSIMAGLFAVMASIGIAHAEPHAKPMLSEAPDGLRSTKMVAIFVTGPNCSTCEATEQLLISRSGAMSRNFDLYKRTDSYTNQGTLQLYLPGTSFPQYEALNFHPSEKDVDGVITGFNKLVDTYADRFAVEKPFLDQANSIDALEARLYAPSKEKLEALTTKHQEAVADLLKRFVETNKAPLEKQIADLKKSKAEALEPYLKDLKKSEPDRVTGRRLFKQMHNAVMAWDSDRANELDKELSERSVKFRSAQDAVDTDLKRIEAEFDAKIRPIEGQLWYLTQTTGYQLSDRYPELRAERKKLDDEFWQAQAGLQEGSSPTSQKLRQAADDVRVALMDSIKPFGPKISAAMDALDEIVSAETPVKDQ